MSTHWVTQSNLGILPCVHNHPHPVFEITPLTASELVKKTSHSAASEENFIKMRMFIFKHSEFFGENFVKTTMFLFQFSDLQQIVVF